MTDRQHLIDLLDDALAARERQDFYGVAANMVALVREVGCVEILDQASADEAIEATMPAPAA